MTGDTGDLCLDVLDLAEVARIIRSAYPSYSLCACARMAAALAPETGCVCSLCAPGVYPGCIRGRAGLPPTSPPGRA